MELVKKFDREYPHFDDGRIDYSDVKEAAVVVMLVKYKDEILLLKRSDKVLSYKNMRNISGWYLDEVKPVNQKAFEELHEELGITVNDIKEFKVRKEYSYKDKDIDMLWHVCPCVIELNKKPEITLDWESTDYVWIKPNEVRNYDILPELDKNIDNLLKDE